MESVREHDRWRCKRSLRPCASAAWARRDRNLGWAQAWQRLGSTAVRPGAKNGNNQVTTRRCDPGWIAGTTQDRGAGAVLNGALAHQGVGGLNSGRRSLT